MLIIRSPQRISLGGGGTDLKSYYKDFGGSFISAAINKYVYVVIIDPFKKGIYLKYSNLEKVKKISQIKHPIFREVLKKFCPTLNKIEITTLSDIPAGTGLGSSSSFTTALIKAVSSYKNENITQNELAEAVCQIEIDILKEPIGKQDQYISSYGGIKHFTINNKGKVRIKKLNLEKKTILDLEENLLLFFTGFTRKASSILQDQVNRTETNNLEMIDNLHSIKEFGYKIKKYLENGDTESFAKQMHEHWMKKKIRTKNMSNNKIDEIYKIALSNGAIGGKIVGAGGGGFLMLYSYNNKMLRKKMNELGLSELRFKFDFEGTYKINL